MLGDRDAQATVAVKDLKVARPFYEGVLGLKALPSDEPAVQGFQAGKSVVLVYESDLSSSARRAKAHEVEIEVLYCGVCHSDIHQVKNEWHNTVYPCVPGPRDRRPRHQGRAGGAQACGGRHGRRRLHDRQLRQVRGLHMRRPELLHGAQQLAGHLQRPDAAEE
jgi:hypothetical protein